ncbi:hypothetical protein llg_23110 [Luteolibacter sp. LG18]|nr:hypothetical protein llg_23110 [Luteolibacter sp. LG18]
MGAAAVNTIHFAQGANASWDGGASTVNLGDAANWTGDTTPGGNGDIATWNGTVAGNLVLSWGGGFGSSPNGTNFYVTSTNTGSLTLDGTGNLAFGNLTIESGAGAVSFGDGSGTAGFVFRNPGGNTSNTLINNSVNTATFKSDLSLNSGSGAGRTVTFDGAGNWQVDTSLKPAGAGGFNVTKSGTGILTLTNANTGGNSPFIISGGTLRIGGGGQLNGGSFSQTITNNATFSYNSSSSQAISGVISGTGTVIVGAGTLSLSAVNTYGGGTTINGGTLTVSGSGSINSTSGITVDGTGAKYLHDSSTASTRNITLTRGFVAGTGTIGAVTVGNGTGGVVANGNGNSIPLTVGSLSFNGGAAISITDDGNPATSGIIVSNALSTVPANGQVIINASNSFWNSGVTYNLVSCGSFGGAISNFTKGTIGGLTSRQSSVLVLNGSTIGLQILGDSPKWTGLDSSNWKQGSTGANGNWQLVNGGNQTDYVDGDVVLFDDTAVNTTVSISGASVNPSVVNFSNSSQTYFLSGDFGIASGSLNKNGAGALIISAPNSYSGGTTMNAGTIALSGNGTLGSSSNPLTCGGGLLDLGGLNCSVGALTISGEVVIQQGSLTATGLTASNSVAAATISANLTLGAGSITKTGGASLGLTGSTSYSGATNINGGTLALGGAASIAGSSAIALGGGALDLGGSSQTSNAITIAAPAATGATILNGTISPSALSVTTTAGIAIISANITGTTGIAVNGGGGTLSLTGNNSFSGALNFTAPATVTIDGGVNTGGGAISYNSFGTTVTINSGSYVTSGITSNGLSEFRSLNLNGGTLQANGNLFADTLAVSINFNGGTLKSGNAAGIALFDYNNLIQINGSGGTFDTTGGPITVGNNADMIGAGNVHVPTVNQPKISGTAGGIITLMGGNTLVAGIGNTGMLGIQDSSTWNLNGIASSVGGLSGGGTVTSTPGSAALTINFGSANGPYTYSGAIAGAANISLIKAGDGTQILAGINSYTGDTTVTGGILAVLGNSLPDTGKVVVDGGRIEANGMEVVGTLYFGATQQAAGTWGATGSGAEHIDDARFSGVSGFLLVTAGPGGYATWAAANAGGQAANLDYDHDGVSNGVEYFMGQSGSSFTANAALVGGTVTWPKSATFSGTYKVQTSTNLTTWTDVTATDNGTSVSYSPPSGQGKLFVRLLVTPN